MNTQLLGLLKLDLIMIGAHPIQPIESPYLPTDEWLEAMNKAYNAVRRATQRKQRINALVNAFYMGKLIESSVTPREKWMEFVRQKSIPHERFYYGVTRIYRLFITNVDQIYLTQHMTLRKVYRLTKQQYQELIDFKEDYEEDFVI